MIITDFNEMSIGDLQKIAEGLPMSFIIEDGRISGVVRREEDE